MQTSTIAALLRLTSLVRDDWESALQEILRIASEVLGVQQSSYWSIRDHPPGLFCELCYVASSGLFERGTVLDARTCPVYMDEVRRLQLINADDARADLRTRDLRPYLETHDIGALLDVPVCARGKPVGVLCNENVGGRRAWTPGEQEFALAVGQTMASMLEARARGQSERAERHAIFLSEQARILAEPLEVDKVADLAVRNALPILGDMAALVAFEAGGIRHQAHAHIDAKGQDILDEWRRAFPPSLEGPFFFAWALREKRSLLLPVVTAELLVKFGGEPAARLGTLKVQSAIAVPFHLRGEVTGCISLFSATRSFGEDDLRFAEAYARLVSGALENARLRQEAEEAIRVRDEFLSLASHELRTPLTALRTAAELIGRRIDRGETSPEVLRRMGQLVITQVERLDALSQQILDASQIAFGAPSSRSERLDLTDLVRKIAGKCARRALLSGSRLVMRLETPVWGHWDATQVERIVSHLLDNAIKFGAGHPIEVTVRSEAGRALLIVRDHGIGISAEHLQDIFERYRRNVSARNFGGLGLGLYIVWTMVRAQGGTVRVESQPGEGATFTVELPQRDAGP